MSFESSTRVRARLLTPAAREAARERIATVLRTTGRPASGKPIDDLVTAFESFDRAEFWLALAVLHGELPVASELRRIRRLRELDGAWAALGRTLRLAASGRHYPTVTVVGAETTLLDVTGLLPEHAAHEGRGIARTIAREWGAIDGVVPVTWTAGGRSLRALTPAEASSIGLPAPHFDSALVLVPHDSAYVLIGTVDKPRSSECLIALGQVSRNATSSVGYGLRPLVSSQAYTRQEGEERFSWHVAAQRSFAHLAVVGDAVIEHYRGWEQMLPAIGLTGPVLHDVPLPARTSGAVDPERERSEWQALSRTVGSLIGIHQND
jgi:hypothetical protein